MARPRSFPSPAPLPSAFSLGWESWSQKSDPRGPLERFRGAPRGPGLWGHQCIVSSAQLWVWGGTCGRVSGGALSGFRGGDWGWGMSPGLSLRDVGCRACN